MQQNWIFRKCQDEQKIADFSQQLRVPPVISRVLLNRGIDTFEKARAFFRPQLDFLHDPFLMRDMDRAVDRVVRAIKNRERILLYGDYDVDGTTAVSMLYLFFRRLGLTPRFYIPHRLWEGYGLSSQGIRQAARWGVDLIISADCGIGGVQEVALAKQLGMDVIITDHHEPGPQLPPADAVLNPKRADCSYPYKELAGIGVAYKLLQALIQALKLDPEILEEHLDLVAVGSAADIVPLTGENRILVKNGLERLAESDKLGFQALMESSGLRGHEITTGHVVFILAPRINAVGRLGSAERAVHLLISDSKQQAKNIASILEAENRARRNLDEETFQQAEDMLAETYDPEKDWVIVLASPDWHPGVIGIVASRIVEKYFRPTVLIAVEENVGRGSARSIPAFDIHAALKACGDLMLGFGGHKHAAGLTLEADRIPQLRQRLNAVAHQRLQKGDLIPQLFIDAELSFQEIEGRFLRLLRLFAPYGPQNMRPVFLTRNVEVVGSPQIVGENHLKLTLRQDRRVFDGIGFNLGDLIHRISSAPTQGPGGRPGIDVVYDFIEEEYQGRSTLQLRIKDLR